MKNQGFIQIPVLVAIIAITAVLGAGTFVVVKHNAYKSPPEANTSSVVNSDAEQEQSNHSTKDVSEKNTVEVQNSQRARDIQSPAKPEYVAENPTDNTEEFHEAKVLVHEFLNNPTQNNFEAFCRKGQNVMSPKTIQVFNEDRTDYVDKHVTVAYAIGQCEYILNRNHPDYVRFVNASEDNMVEFKDGESDAIRKFKIEYNNKIKQLNNAYKFYSYESLENLSPPEIIENSIKEAEEKTAGWRGYRGYRTIHFTTPEQQVRDVFLSYF